MPLNNKIALRDFNFLKKLDAHRSKTVWIRIVSLNWNEEPLNDITGYAQSGSISVSGSSRIRRTCSLSLLTNDPQIDDALWALKSKFKVEIGVNNDIDNRYEPIIWFPQGVYIITSFSTSVNDGGAQTVSISGKDKMCLLNGEIGGSLFASHEFAKIWTQHADGTTTKELIPIKTIIKEAVHQYGQEPYHNIVINDLDICGVELIDYIGKKRNIYVYDIYKNDEFVSSNIIFGEELSWEDDVINSPKPSEENFYSNIDFYPKESNSLCKLFLKMCYLEQRNYDLDQIRKMSLNSDYSYRLRKCVCPSDVDTTVGYRATDLTYTGELTIALGGKITEMLDKLVEMLGEFEYFYNLEGQFVFQRKRIYFNSQWSNVEMEANTAYYDIATNTDGAFYEFINDQIVASIQNNPKMNAVKNDYAIWGKKKSSTGKEWPIHLRYAIDRKPKMYYSLLDERMYVSNEYEVDIKDENEKVISKYRGQYDWRELIYQMARDNQAANTRINGLSLALKTIWSDTKLYHYDFDKLTASKWPDYYQYNDVTKKFVKLTSKGEFESCKEQNIFLYGPKLKYAKKGLTSKDIKLINLHLGYDFRCAQSEEQMIYDFFQAFGKTPNDIAGILTNKQSINNTIDAIPDEQIGGKDAKAYFKELITILYTSVRKLNNYTVTTTGEEVEILGELETLAENSQLKAIQYMQDELALWQNTFSTGYDAYYADILEFWPKIYRTKQSLKTIYDDAGNIAVDALGNLAQNDDYLEDQEWRKYVANGFWNPFYCSLNYNTGKVQFKQPEALWFWIDFADPTELASLQEYAVETIGRRSTTLNDDKIRALYFRPTPSIMFVDTSTDLPEYSDTLSMVHIQLVPPYTDYFSISSQGKSAKEMLDSQVYNGTYLQESISISCLPIYYMEPNVRIAINNSASAITGQFIVESFTIPLSYNGMMSINATRTDDRDRIY